MQFNQEDIDIGERLRGIRENMHMTREQFSEKIDIISKKHIFKIYINAKKYTGFNWKF